MFFYEVTWCFSVSDKVGIETNVKSSYAVILLSLKASLQVDVKAQNNYIIIINYSVVKVFITPCWAFNTVNHTSLFYS